jgi:hypothetical protein
VRKYFYAHKAIPCKRDTPVHIKEGVIPFSLREYYYSLHGEYCCFSVEQGRYYVSFRGKTTIPFQGNVTTTPFKGHATIPFGCDKEKGTTASRGITTIPFEKVSLAGILLFLEWGRVPFHVRGVLLCTLRGIIPFPVKGNATIP